MQADGRLISCSYETIHLLLSHSTKTKNQSIVWNQRFA